MIRSSAAALLVCVALLVVGCGDERPPTAPSNPAPTPAPTPSPTAPSGSISDLQAARDIIRYNQQALGGSSVRTIGVISRWELPVPVYVAPGVSGTAVVDALEHWRERTGVTYAILGTDTEPRLLLRPGDDGLGQATARGFVDGTYSNNRARSGLIVIRPAIASCPTDCRFIFRHELGHALGFFDHFDEFGLMSSSSVDLVPREQAMMQTLYSLPHGAKVEEDGSWRVVLE